MGPPLPPPTGFHAPLPPATLDPHENPASGTSTPRSQGLAACSGASARKPYFGRAGIWMGCRASSRPRLPEDKDPARLIHHQVPAPGRAARREQTSSQLREWGGGGRSDISCRCATMCSDQRDLLYGTSAVAFLYDEPSHVCHSVQGLKAAQVASFSRENPV